MIRPLNRIQRGQVIRNFSTTRCLFSTQVNKNDPTPEKSKATLDYLTSMSKGAYDKLKQVKDSEAFKKAVSTASDGIKTVGREATKAATSAAKASYEKIKETKLSDIPSSTSKTLTDVTNTAKEVKNSPHVAKTVALIKDGLEASSNKISQVMNKNQKPTRVENAETILQDQQQQSINTPKLDTSKLLNVIAKLLTSPTITDTLLRALLGILIVMFGGWLYCLHQNGFTNPDLLHDVRAKLLLFTSGAYLILQRNTFSDFFKQLFSPRKIANLFLFFSGLVFQAGVYVVTNLISILPKSFRNKVINMSSNNSLDAVLTTQLRLKLLLLAMLSFWYYRGAGPNSVNDAFRSDDVQVHHDHFMKHNSEQDGHWFRSLYQVFLKQGLEIWYLTLPFAASTMRESSTLVSQFKTLPSYLTFSSRLLSSAGVVFFLVGLSVQFADRVQKQLYGQPEKNNTIIKPGGAFVYFLNQYKLFIGEMMIWSSFFLVSAACVLAKRQHAAVKLGAILVSAGAPALMAYKIKKEHIDENELREALSTANGDLKFAAELLAQCMYEVWKLIKAQLLKHID
ncbi:hypothetical protein AKO1_010570 [Acrasis kona]|uniref:Uncharacterized protein n=1 Tax=Acrasis kona TaxID=1008807 RepID=A0AAW2ZI92_9EUKA